MAEGVGRKNSPGRSFREDRKGGKVAGSFSVFVDGLADGVTWAKVHAIFAEIGGLRSVFVQRKKREGRRLRFGFIRYNSNQEAERAIRKFNGLKLEGAFLVVKKALYPSSRGQEKALPATHVHAHQYAIRGKLWRPKQNRALMASTLVNIKGDSCPPYNMEEEERQWVERCVAATTFSVISPESLQEGLRLQGLSNFKIKLLGARDVILEFDTKEDMQFTLVEANDMLEEFFEWIKPCEAVTVGRSFLTWIRLWKVPLGVWNYQFFTNIGNQMGKYICVDEITSRKERLDFARVLVETTRPLIEQQFMDINVEGSVVRILLEKELSVYPDWTGLKKEHESRKALDTDDNDVEDEVIPEADVDAAMMTDVPEKQEEEAITAATTEVPLKGLATDGYKDLIEAGYTVKELLQWLQNLAINGVEGMVSDLKSKNQEGSGVQEDDCFIKQGEVSPVDQNNEQVTEIVNGDVWVNKIGISNEWSDVKNGPSKEWVRPIENQQKLMGSRGVQVEELNTLPSSLRKVKELARSTGVKGPFFSNGNDQFRPGQTGLAQPNAEKKRVSWKTDGAGSDGADLGCPGDDGFYAEDHILERVNRRRGRKKVIQAAAKRKGATEKINHGRRGRPKGSRNKPKSEAILPSHSLLNTGTLTAVAWAEKAWSLSKKLGVVFDGDDGVIVDKLAAQVRQNHPNLL